MTFTFDLIPHAQKEQVLAQFKGKKLEELPTPSFIVDKSVFIKNCDDMLDRAKILNADFRAHVKTHKTLEGAGYQLSGSGTKGLATTKVIVSTLAEAWGLIPLVEQGKLDDILFSLPVVKSRLGELVKLSEKVPHLRLMVDNKQQLDVLNEFSLKNNYNKKWSIFIKVNMGTNRAGFLKDDDELNATLDNLFNTDIKDNVELYGFYCHAGHSYKSHSVDEAKKFLIDEIQAGNDACKLALKFNPDLKLQLSFGATPTAHSSTKLDIKTEIGEIFGNLELHAGNYPCCDLQQVGTGCAKHNQVSIKVIAEVVSNYPNRGSAKPGEALINAGVIALTRETGALPGFGNIIAPEPYKNWVVGRLSQEHGILTPTDSNAKMIPIGTQVQIVPQHTCITAASYPWYLVVDGGDEVVDVWVPFRAW